MGLSWFGSTAAVAAVAEEPSSVFSTLAASWSHTVARINQISPLFDHSLRFSASVELLEPSSQRVS